MFKKFLTILLSVFLVLLSCSKTSFIYADDEVEEGEVSDDDIEEVKGCVINGDFFTEEECQEKLDAVRKAKTKIEKEMEEAKANKDAQKALAEKYAAQASSMQTEIDDLSNQIDELKVKIEKLEKQIAENEALVEALNKRVKDRMVTYQTTMHFNGYLEFILGSKSFTDMLRRIYGVEAVLSKDRDDRAEYIEVITQLNNDKAELDEAKRVLDESYTELLVKQQELEEMQAYYEEQAAYYQAEYDRLNTEALPETEESYYSIRKAMEDGGLSPSSSYFVAAVHNSWISEGVWNYSDDFKDGTWHLGVDYAASRYTQIHAPADGVIVRANEGCPDINKPCMLHDCGYPLLGGGNQVYMMVEVDGVVWGFIFMHMNEIYVSKEDFVDQDEVIGTVGSSGQSTGPHCHIEMYKLGYGKLIDFLDRTWDASWNIGGRGRTMYENRCSVSSTPCIVDPEEYLPAN